MTQDQTPEKLAGRVHYSLDDIAIDDWNACTNHSRVVYNPFIDYRYLQALEKSESACAETGWAPFHITLEENEKTVAVMPLYLKSHSRGEYVFDGSWASAWHQAGGNYYPKLQSSVPFTPATGPRLLARPSNNHSAYQSHLLEVASQLAERTKVSSMHITFMTHKEWQLAGSQGLLQRLDTQYHWYNHDYSSFNGFLEDLSSKRRKTIRRERREAVCNDVEIEWVTGSDLKEHHWDAFFEFYEDTCYRKWGASYLTRQFFSMVGESMPSQVLLILAKRANRYIAGAINFIGGDTIFGRNWGCIEHHPFLHFELCYYQAIDFAIEHGLKVVEAGAQGSHKIARGYLARETYSAHWLANASFREAVSDFLRREKSYVESDISYVAAHSPFKAVLSEDR